MKDKKLDPKREDEVLDLVKNLRIPRIILIGGEPATYPNLHELIEKVTSRGIGCGIVTNGRRFKDRKFVEKLKDSGLTQATFSVEGSCSEIYDATTQVKGSFYDSLEGISVMKELGLKVFTNTVISKRNIRDLESIVDTYSNLSVESMGFNICGVCVSKKEKNEYMLEFQEGIRAFEKVYLYSKTKGIKIRLITPMPLCNFDTGLLPDLIRNNAIGYTPCQLSHGRNFVIDYNGDIVPCTHLTGFSLFNIFEGDKIIDKDEFIKRYNSLESKKFRENMSRYASSKCNGCEEKCSGGCPLFWLQLDPDREIIGLKKPLYSDSKV